MRKIKGEHFHCIIGLILQDVYVLKRSAILAGKLLDWPHVSFLLFFSSMARGTAKLQTIGFPMHVHYRNVAYGRILRSWP